MWQIETSIPQIIIRALVVYVVVFVLFRLIGKKPLGQYSPFDLVLLLIVSEGVSNGLTGDEKSLTGALITGATLLGLARLIDFGAYKSRRFEKLVDGASCIIVENGKILEDVRRSEGITMEELMSALRQYEVENVADLKYAILETNGKITVIKKDSGK